MTSPTQGEGGSAKRWCYSIRLFSKMGDKGEGEIENLKKGWHHLWTSSNKNYSLCTWIFNLIFDFEKHLLMYLGASFNLAIKYLMQYFTSSNVMYILKWILPKKRASNLEIKQILYILSRSSTALVFLTLQN